ncbi:c-type cytochrome [Billgrantia tianxiuensis]|jgi:mono/diheme cytochrome c family protein|uniref:C-type cytochrome n=1 Tax=Billgrantia tianxiuensis TaxID=2497861 RepID=A0A6I6SQL8_9GAMM|nr:MULTISPECIES: c-type cytochrome [Halomonas]MCE8035934.1 c-type cytochrome [Halomonas sp. MCCC 1A11057]QHC51571.1 c-type cytochrome [Halomonas tianxiuensis]
MTVSARAYREALPLFVVALLALGLPIAGLADEHRITGEGPGAFIVEDGKVDPDTYEGYLVYTRACMACHGPDGMGSSFAPNLIRAVERRGWENFAGTIASGREVQPGQVMPSFADDPYVMGNIPKIFSYMRARGEGGLGRGRPQIIESMQQQDDESEAEGEKGEEKDKAAEGANAE